MDVSLTSELPAFIGNLTYFAIFIGAVIEGEAVLLAGSFAASLGFLNIWWVLAIVFVGEVLADSAWYWVGRLAKENVLHRIERWFKLSPELLDRVEHYYSHHGPKILVGFKFVVGLRLATLIAAGLVKMPFGKFLRWNILSIFLWTLGVGAIGYFFGESYERLERVYGQVGIVFAVFIVGLIVLEIFLGKKFTKKFYERETEVEKQERLQGKAHTR